MLELAKFFGRNVTVFLLPGPGTSPLASLKGRLEEESSRGPFRICDSRGVDVGSLLFDADDVSHVSAITDPAEVGDLTGDEHLGVYLRSGAIIVVVLMETAPEAEPTNP